jgi:glycerate kinase
MKILIAPDAFKEALSAALVCEAIHRGLRQSDLSANICLFPLADGGEGSASVLARHNNGSIVEVAVSGPLLEPTTARYGFAADGQTAFIEMAAASGLQLVPPDKRNPLLSSTYGTGELLLHAYRNGARHFVLCIGGSATHDLGFGMATALGYQFTDGRGKTLQMCGRTLSDVMNIDASDLKINLRELTVEVLCDVNNPLTGAGGAARVYARQKGANEEAVKILEAGSQHAAALLSKYAGKEISNVPGAGAAGGMGAGAMAFLQASLRPGISSILDKVHFDEQLKDASLVITGEGHLDAQSAHGKLIHGVCQRAKRYDVPVIALCGQLSATPAAIKAMGLTAAFCIQHAPVDLATALASTEKNLSMSAFNLGQILKNHGDFSIEVVLK